MQWMIKHSLTAPVGLDRRRPSLALFIGADSAFGPGVRHHLVAAACFFA
jgi:hypothetical protein